jgi:heme O synthase-like polyprenyltransferase
MKRKRNAVDERRRRKMFTVLWTALLAIITILLLYWEMTALLYILATLGVTALLVVVALADLSHSENMSDAPRRIDDSAAIASGITRQS